MTKKIRECNFKRHETRRVTLDKPDRLNICGFVSSRYNHMCPGEDNCILYQTYRILSKSYLDDEPVEPQIPPGWWDEEDDDDYPYPDAVEGKDYTVVSKSPFTIKMHKKPRNSWY